MNHIATSGDPFEMGSARPLDFGHWAAHKLEQLSEYRIRHGEAVAVGIALDCIYARRMEYLDPKSCDRIVRLLLRLGFSLWAGELLHEDDDGQLVVLEGLEEFREHLGGRLTINIISSDLPGAPVDSEPRYARTLEVMRALRSWMRGDALETQGEFYSFALDPPEICVRRRRCPPGRWRETPSGRPSRP